MPEPTNADRAAWAEDAVNAFALDCYCGRTFTNTVVEQPNDGDDAYTMIQDLMSNLLHLANQHGWDAKEMNNRSVRMFEDELADEVAS